MSDWLFTAGWALWVAFFAVLEGIALARRAPGDTLSEHVWRLFGIRPVWFAALGAFVWLGLHFFGFGFV